jgi:RNA polymerase sigma-70 factor, ECF subfamily
MTDRERDRVMPQDFDLFCRQHYPAVYRAALMLSSKKEIAEDATQEAFSRAFARWGMARQQWSAGWVMTTALNLCRRHLKDSRRVGREGSHEPGEVPGPTPQRADLLFALRELPARQQQVVILHYFGDLSVHAVAELMNLTDGTVKSYLFRSRTTMKQSLSIDDEPASTTVERNNEH